MKPISDTINDQWLLPSHSKIDWATLETTIRQILREYENDTLDPKLSLALIDEAFAAWTRRGNTLSIHHD